MGVFKKLQQFDLTNKIRTYFDLVPYEDIITWCQKNIDYSNDVSSQRNKLDFNFFHYQVPIIKELAIKPGVIKNVVFVSSQQLGKTNTFICGLLYNMVFNPGQSLVVYPSDDLAKSTNRTKIVPLLLKLDSFKHQFQKSKRCIGQQSYNFSNCISYFIGAGTRIISRSCNWVAGDEVDNWTKIEGINNVAQIKKRTRSFSSSVCYLISTPTTDKGRIWQQFEKSSQGYYYLRCKNCNQLTMRSCDTNNLQFKSTYNQQNGQRTVIPDSIRLICPKCGHEHVEADKAWMILNGDYIHTVPERLSYYPGFQCGGLVSQLPSMSWANIAAAQLEAGKRADLDAQMTFDISYRGLPYHRRDIVKEDIQRIRDHFYRTGQQLKPEDIEFVFGAVDSMQSYFRYGIFASDTSDNIHLIKVGQVKHLTLDPEERQKIDQTNKQQAMKKHQKFVPIETLEDVIYKQYYGFKPLIVAQDARSGHGNNYYLTQQFIVDNKPMIGYLGTKMTGDQRYRLSTQAEKNRKLKLFNVNALSYKIDAIWYLYTQKKRDGQYLFIYNDIPVEYLEQIKAMQPDYNKNNGQLAENWTSQNRQDHAFDCLKMAYFVRDFCINKRIMSKDRFNYCKSPRLRRQYERKTPSHLDRKKEQKQQKETKRYFNTTENYLKT